MALSLVMRGSALVAALLVRAYGQVHVMSPDSLVKKYELTRGAIQGSTATFGAPFYGDRVLGQLVYAPSVKGKNYCEAEDYNVKPPAAGDGNNEKAKLITIIMVRRGNCSFTKKVQVASEKGAHAVIIVDRLDSDLQGKDMRNIIVADDGFGENIRIPSVLISKEDGKALMDEAGRSPVIVELAWNVPQDHVVQTDLWMSSASKESLRFLKEFAPKRRLLNKVMSFTPHYAVFGMDAADHMTASNLCSDTTGKFCAEDPDGPGRVLGKDVLEENVRQLCIHENYQKPEHEAVHHVQYAAEFWDYIEKFPDRCPLEKFGSECSKALMTEVGIDVGTIEACAQSTGPKKLENERKNAAWSPRALRINGWRYSGVMGVDLVTRAICSGFNEQPQECKDLIKPRDPTVPFGENPSAVSFSQLIKWLFGTVLVASLALLLYKRYLKKEMRATLREEVMLEVQAQMGEYSKLSGR